MFSLWGFSRITGIASPEYVEDLKLTFGQAVDLEISQIGQIALTG